MSFINTALWETEFGTPLPPNLSYWEYAVIRQKKHIAEEIKAQLYLVKKIVELDKARPELNLAGTIKKERIKLGKLYVEKRKLETRGLDNE